MSRLIVSHVSHVLGSVFWVTLYTNSFKDFVK